MLDKNVLEFNLFNSVEHIVEAMRYLDFLNENDDNPQRKNTYNAQLNYLKMVANNLCNLGERLLSDNSIIETDQQVIDYIDKIQERIRIKKASADNGSNN